MRLSPKVLALAMTALALAGCGTSGSSTPMAALRQEFGGSEISRVYPFRANLAKGSYLYFLQLKGPTASPTAAIVTQQGGGWSVWEFSAIEVVSGCAKPATVSAAPIGTPLPPAGAPTVIAGRIEGSAQAQSLSYSVGGKSFAAKLLPDGFWFAITNGKGGRTAIRLIGPGGAPIPFCQG